MTRFISTHRMKNVIEEYRLTDSNTPYAEMVRSFKWANRDGKDSKVDLTVKNGGVISIKDSLITQNEVLKRSLMGEFNASVVLSEVRRPRVESNPRSCAIAGTSGVQQLLSLTNKAHIQSVEREILGPKESLGHNPTEVNLPPLILKGKSCEAHEDSLSGLKNIKELASQFLEAFRAWEFSSDLNVRENMASQVTPEENSLMQVKERIESSINNDMSRRAENEYISIDQTPPETRETDLQIQQILDAEPVAMQNLVESETTETEAPSWVNSHILELSNTYGVAFEGFEKETLALLMRIDERKSMLDNKGKEITTTTPKSRGIGKNELKNLQSSLNKEFLMNFKLCSRPNTIANKEEIKKIFPTNASAYNEWNLSVQLQFLQQRVNDV
uniref:Uncharacterized protein n=1 Tax=Solanum tuberosum TaxID=4113 RepID=M1DK11_SOLTU